MIQTIKQLYFRYKELINYVIVGGLTTVVSLTSYYFFTTAFLDQQDPFQLMAANTFSWICAVSFAYITNRKFVFESKSTDKLRARLPVSAVFHFHKHQVSAIAGDDVDLSLPASEIVSNQLVSLFLQILPRPSLIRCSRLPPVHPVSSLPAFRPIHHHVPPSGQNAR